MYSFLLYTHLGVLFGVFNSMFTRQVDMQFFKMSPVMFILQCITGTNKNSHWIRFANILIWLVSSLFRKDLNLNFLFLTVFLLGFRTRLYWTVTEVSKRSFFFCSLFFCFLEEFQKYLYYLIPWCLIVKACSYRIVHAFDFSQ